MDAGHDHYHQHVGVRFAGLESAATSPRRYGFFRGLGRGLAAVPEGLAALRKVMLDLTAVAAPFAVVIALASILSEKTIIIEAPTVPQDLLERGVTPELLTRLVQARVQEIREEARSNKTPEIASPEQEPLTIEAAGVSFSLNTLAHTVERVLGLQSARQLKLAILCTGSSCGDGPVTLRVVALAGDRAVGDVVSFDLAQLDAGIDVAAVHLLKNFDPHLLGTFYARQGRYTEAEAIARSMILQRDAQEVWAHNLLGTIAIRKADLAVASAHFDQALQIDAGFAPALVNLGIVEVQQDRLDEGIAFYKRAIEVDPDNAIAYVNLGRALLRRCDWEGAGGAFEQAIAADPALLPAHQGLAQVKDWHEKDKVGAQVAQQFVADSEAPGSTAQPTLLEALNSARNCIDRNGLPVTAR